VPPGRYAIRELIGTGWRLQSIGCASAGGSEFAYVGSQAAVTSQDAFDAGDHTAEVGLAPGDDVTCTFSNVVVPVVPVPALSDALLAALAMLMLAAGTVALRRRASGVPGRR
jgi:hypothetical protein